MTRQRQQRTPAAASEPPAGPSPAPDPDPSPAATAEAEEDVRAELVELRAQLAGLREQVDEHHAVLATRIERRRRRIDHPRLYPQRTQP